MILMLLRLEEKEFNLIKQYIFFHLLLVIQILFIIFISYHEIRIDRERWGE